MILVYGNPLNSAFYEEERALYYTKMLIVVWIAVTSIVVLRYIGTTLYIYTKVHRTRHTMGYPFAITVYNMQVYV